MDRLESPYELLVRAALLIPISHYILGFLFLCGVFLYNFMEIHFLRDLFTGFRGQPVSLTFNSCSEVYQEVISKCKVLHGRYLSTPWLCSPHVQTTFLHFFGRPPICNYRRQIFHTPDGGTLALDWLTNRDAKKSSTQLSDEVQIDDETPILILVPGLTSDSESAYVKHLACKMASRGWKVVVTNHRGLGGISITSDCFYNAGWTEDVRKVIEYIHGRCPKAPLFAVGTSIGANILVKYLGEEGQNIPIVGAVAICSPWDLLICDRFINRRLVQRFYDRALTIGLKDYAHLHQSILSRLTDWEGITKSRSVRDFDHHATRVLGKYETVDTYYRRNSSVPYMGYVAVPLLCISSIDDPVCTSEAIPWDECRANKNIILAVTQHGGHLAYFEGLTANSVWWVRAVDEFLHVLHSSRLIHKKKEIQNSSVINPLESSIDRAPYVNVLENGMVSAAGNEQTTDVITQHDEHTVQNNSTGDLSSCDQEGAKVNATNELMHPSEREINNTNITVRKCLDQITRHSRKSIWILAYIAIMTTWPVLGSALAVFFKRRLRNAFPGRLQK